MKDCFELLNEPRRPWLDPDNLKRKFLGLSAQLHPDRQHGASDEEKRIAHERYADLNAAYNRLRDPRDRLLHFVELESGKRPQSVQEIPKELVSLFTEINQGCRETDTLLADKAKTASPLLQVELFDRAQKQSQKLSALQQNVGARIDHLLERVQAIDREWISEKEFPGRADALRQLEELFAPLSFFTRWRAQIQERLVQLAM